MLTLFILAYASWLSLMAVKWFRFTRRVNREEAEIKARLSDSRFNNSRFNDSQT